MPEFALAILVSAVRESRKAKNVDNYGNFQVLVRYTV